MKENIEVLERIEKLLDCLKEDVNKQKELVKEIENEPDNETLLKKYKYSMVALVFGYMAFDNLQKEQIEKYSEITGLDLSLEEEE